MVNCGGRLYSTKNFTFKSLSSSKLLKRINFVSTLYGVNHNIRSIRNSQIFFCLRYTKKISLVWKTLIYQFLF